MFKGKYALSCQSGLLVATLVAVPAYSSAQEEESVSELESLTVTAERVGAQGPDVGYQAERSLTATKTDTPLSETPFWIMSLVLTVLTTLAVMLWLVIFSISVV